MNNDEYYLMSGALDNDFNSEFGGLFDNALNVATQQVAQNAETLATAAVQEGAQALAQSIGVQLPSAITPAEPAPIEPLSAELPPPPNLEFSIFSDDKKDKKIDYMKEISIWFKENETIAYAGGAALLLLVIFIVTKKKKPVRRRSRKK